MASIAIVGAGTAGSASALFLSRAGHRVTLFEAVREPQPVGAGIMLQPTGMHALRRLGLLQPILDAGHRVDSLRCLEHGGRLLFDLEYARWDPVAFGLGIHRGVLFQTLFEAASATVDTLRCGVSIQRLGPAQTLIDEKGESYGPYDLIIVADGARSQIRRANFPGARDQTYPWGALWFVAQDPEERFARVLLQRVRGADRMVGLLPTGLPPGATEPVVSLFISVRADRAQALKDSGAEGVRQHVLSVAPEAEQILDQLDDASALLFAEYRDVAVAPLFVDRTVFLGDAAHAMSPQLGQGANLALWDAMVLCDQLPLDVPDIPAALAAFASARHQHLRFYQWMTRGLTPFFQSDSRLLGAIRNTVMPLAVRVPWVGRQMVATMCGVKTGPLGHLTLPPAP